MDGRNVAIIGTRGYPSYYGGFETLVRHLVPYLAERGWNVTVYSRHMPPKEELEDGVVVRKTPGLETKSLSTLSYGLTSTVHAARNNFDVALVMNVANGFWLPALRRAKIPSVVNVDGIEWERAKWGRLARSIFRTGAKLTARSATTIVCDSTAIQTYWSQKFGRASDYIPYGGDKVSRAEVPAGLVSRKYILIVARFVPENTVVEFFEAAETLSRTYDVVIVGSSGYGGPLDEHVENLCKKNARIKWLGHISNDEQLYALWHHAGVYFHGHSVGGTNPALVQAMACGAPVVARDTVYNREVLGDAGIFVEPTASAISGAILSLMADQTLVEGMTAAAQSRAESQYTWESVCDAYEKSLISTLEKIN